MKFKVKNNSSQTEVYTSPWPMNHSPEYFTRPLEFLPERWLDSSRQNSEFSADVLSASQPFQLGPRGCLGRNFAMMEIGLSLAKLVWKYDLELANPNYNWADHVKIHVLWWKPELAVRITDASGTLYTVGMSNECMI
jgi:cytochrome P450